MFFIVTADNGKSYCWPLTSINQIDYVPEAAHASGKAVPSLTIQAGKGVYTFRGSEAARIWATIQKNGIPKEVG